MIDLGKKKDMVYLIELQLLNVSAVGLINLSVVTPVALHHCMLPSPFTPAEYLLYSPKIEG